MATYRRPSLSLKDACVPSATLGYYRLRFYQAMHEFILREFNRLAASEQPLARKALAKRIDRDASQITVWLRDPSNMEFESFSDLMVGMGVDPRRIVAQLAVPAEPSKAKTDDDAALRSLLDAQSKAIGQPAARPSLALIFAPSAESQGAAVERTAFLAQQRASDTPAYL